MKRPSLPGSIEYLEARIAPATIFVGDPNRNDTEFREPPGQGGTEVDPNFITPFVNTADAVGDPIAQVIGPGDSGQANIFYVKLASGDRFLSFDNIQAGYTPFITGPDGGALKGTVIAVFVDLNNNNEVDANELTGLSLGKNVSVQVSGTVFGDVASNYNDQTGSLGGSGEASGSATDLLNNKITLFSAGAVTGNILSGGDIQNLKITNDVGQILTGKAANGFDRDGAGPQTLSYDFNGAQADGGDTLAVNPAAGKRGVNINNVSAGAVNVIQAGGGGAGGKGGMISNVTLVSDVNGFIIQGGEGGDGTGARTKGGVGGKVTNILVNGLDENQVDPTDNDTVEIRGGQGGAGASGSAGVGGKGGDVSKVSFGFEVQGGQISRSVNALEDEVLLKGGDGGAGKNGGAGAKLIDNKVFARPSLAGNDIQALAGIGGANLTSVGKAGKGGDIVDLNIQNPGNTNEEQASRIVVKSGVGGTTSTGGTGAPGGSITNGSFVGFSVDINAGNGSVGRKGGKGGNVNTILITDGFEDVRAENVEIDAGGGALGSNGKGGKGGAIDDVRIENADFSFFEINQDLDPVSGIRSADGGASKIGAGSVGGSVSDLTVNDVRTLTGDPLNPELNTVVMQLRAGAGGNGGNGTAAGGKGGKGGSFTGNNTIVGVDASLLIQAGAGGSATLRGAGGTGGDINTLSFNSVGISVPGVPGDPGDPDADPPVPPTPPVPEVPNFATLNAGAGGVGESVGKGGAGGNLKTLNVIIDGVALVQAGNGGNGNGSGAAGRGGAINDGAMTSQLASVALVAGDAATAGGKAGAGGAIGSMNILATTTISLASGDGGRGGAGGNISEIGASDPTGFAGSASLSVIAGNGSGGGPATGSGGSISGFDGYVGKSGLTLLKAGQGGAGTTKAANGGSISEVNFLGGGGDGAEVQIEAGDAGAATGAKKGGTGGSVRAIGIGVSPFDEVDVDNPNNAFAIDPSTILRRIVGGEGGATTSGTGGTGGSILDVRVNHDIGVRSGAAFGFATMGGIFAGAGGLGPQPGEAGDVIGISADAIAAIVAGKPLNGEVITARNLVTEVDGLALNGNSPGVVDNNGTYRNFDAAVPGPPRTFLKANIVGGVVNPDEPGTAYGVPGEFHANTFDLNQGEFLDNDGNARFSLGDATTDKTDGFVAAIEYVGANGTNVRVEALLTPTDFIDLSNINNQIVVPVPPPPPPPPPVP